MMDERAQRVSEILRQAAETHHVVYRITDGADDDWASWYSEWLLNLSDLPEVLGVDPVRSELTWFLVQMDKDHTDQSSGERWEDWYAERLVTHFGS